jgi:hypothetical protein
VAAGTEPWEGMAGGAAGASSRWAAAALVLLVTVAPLALSAPGDGALPVVDGVISPGEYAHNQSFQSDLFHLLWTIDNDTLHLAIEARTTGWIALGLEPSVLMKDADMIIGWWNGTDDFVVEDAYATGQTGPHPPDTEIGGSYDILTYLATQSGGWTRIELTRSVDTGDPLDRAIRMDGPMKIMWAVSDTTDIGGKHAQRGLATVDFFTGKAKEVSAPNLWPLHAALMTAGTVLFLATYFSLEYKKQRKKWWMEAHHYTGTAAVLTAVAGLSIGFYMVAGLSAGHLRVVHSLIGATTLVMGLLSLVVGFVFLRVKSLKRTTRRPHILFGALGIVMMIVTVISGLMHVFPAK